MSQRVMFEVGNVSNGTQLKYEGLDRRCLPQPSWGQVRATALGKSKRYLNIGTPDMTPNQGKYTTSPCSINTRR